MHDPYSLIGVQSFINCCGTRTIHGGTLMLPQVREAMMAASRFFVNMDELMAGAGKRLATLTGAEWGMVAPGAAACLCHATAACVTGGDPELMFRLPDTSGMKREVIMPRESRFTYDHAIRSVGVTIVEVDNLGEMDAMLDREQVAMVALLGTWEADMTLESVVGMARRKDVPVLVDAASEHLQSPEPYTNRGANLVAYSGGKYLRGPQPTGLLLGDRDLVEAAWVHAAPHHTLGRAMKIGKEEVMGILAAVEYLLKERDSKTEYEGWITSLETIAQHVTRVPGVEAEILASDQSDVPRLEIRWDGDRIGLTGLELREQLLCGDPRIMLDDRGATDTSIFILPFSLQPGEADIVGEHIRDALSHAPLPSKKKAREPIDVSGAWEIEIALVRKKARHRVDIEQSAGVLTGNHQTRWLKNSLNGSVNGDEIVFTSQHRFEGTHLSYRFVGTVSGDEICGEVEMGSSGQSAPGPLNQREYGTAGWRAVRR
ncbi:MAG: hypothetical protein J4F29_11045 [Candidatus Latescibacteria bacterium]|nr:hypothetical protein [Candidatus Latescibacterota bacterium]